MAKTRSRPSRPARTAQQRRRQRRPPQRTWLARNGVVLAAALMVALGAVILLQLGGYEVPDQVDGGTAGVTGPDFHSLVADPTTPGRLFVGGHQAVSASTDGGATWERIDSLDGADAMGWGFTDDAIFVSGHPGLNRSDDGGATFARINEGLPGIDVHAFGAGGGVLYGSAVDGGLFASTDGGASWEVRSSEGTQAFFGHIVVDPADPQHLYAADAQRGAVESSDGGRSWQVLDSRLPIATWMSASGDDLDVLIASGPAGAARSTDRGETWQPMQLPAGGQLVEVSPTDPDVIYAGIHEDVAVRVQVSRDGGQSWEPA